MNRMLFAALAAPMFGAAAIAQPLVEGQTDPVATATFINSEGEESGMVRLFETPNGLLLSGEVMGLSHGEHGFHVHETGECETPDFTSAGDHFDPYGNEHGLMNADGPHAGDMLNLTAMENTNTVARAFLGNVTLKEGEGALLDDDGAAIIVHEDPDSYAEEAGAGGRVLCAVIEPVEG